MSAAVDNDVIVAKSAETTGVVQARRTKDGRVKVHRKCDKCIDILRNFWREVVRIQPRERMAVRDLLAQLAHVIQRQLAVLVGRELQRPTIDHVADALTPAKKALPVDEIRRPVEVTAVTPAQARCHGVPCPSDAQSRPFHAGCGA